MASQKDTKTSAESASPFAGFMPEGWDAKDNKKVGGRTPIYAAKQAFENKFPPAIGLMIAVDVLDMGDSIEDEDQRYRPFIRMEAKVATKCVIGKKGPTQKQVDIAVGDEFYLPMSGNIKNIKAIQAYLADKENIYLGLFAVTGTLPTGRPTDMWVIDSQVNEKYNGKLLKRTGKYVVSEDRKALGAGGITNSGQRYNADGVVIENESGA